jgi:hypothetical protein
VVQFLGIAPLWDRYDDSDGSLHIQYVDGEGAISLVTMMRPDSVPR